MTRKRRALVYGLAVAGEATARALLARGYTVTVADDRATEEALAVARRLGVDLYEAPPAPKVERLVERSDVVVPSPGIPERHPVIVSAQRLGVPLRTEIDLAYEWEQARVPPRPMLAVTGTDGKTTTTLLATAMLEASGARAVAAGNTETPLVSALAHDVDAFVVECTSFRLAWTTCFRPVAAVWLNVAEDHLDWHATMEAYIAAKARMWRFQHRPDAAIGFAADPIVMTHLADAPARHVTFGSQGADYHIDGDWLVGPPGRLAPLASMRRALPHDVTNALAAAALVLESRLGTVDGVAAALATFEGPHHRIELVADDGAVRFYDDSKATTPHAALTAIRSFDHVVLVAGGRNKGLDLAPMAVEPQRVRSVVAIGEAAPDLATIFAGVSPVTVAASMDDAVAAARAAAQPGDVVLLSPGCASFDWYGGYAERGDDFVRAVRAQVEVPS
ncbi:MAG TPA: UDP-N-acetylmuramoyl-L-alanine--D-glutamate ligase [Acidimicrobiales bacterium]|nr:UDP-N-acetylmuramoyl-L-alanine--D-glutamate ligase [Acidimicrobiales bacterium]